MIDTHCHLTFPDYAGRVDEVLANARAHGVMGCITISTTTRDCLDGLALAERHENVWCTAGVHPLYSDTGPHEWENLRKVAMSPKCVAWGELGLDSHYQKPEKKIQREVLEEQLAFIQEASGIGHQASGGGGGIDLPVQVHCREAFAELIPILAKTRLRPERFVFHCFTGGVEDMKLVLDFGAWVSITGVVTYKNAPELREAVKMLPLERLMVETDAPFLSPEPFRGVRPNEPRYARVTAEFLAGLYGVGWEEFHARINENVRRFFGIEAGGYRGGAEDAEKRRE